MNNGMSAMPFPVDYKKRHNDRIFKQVAFPGTDGTYRLRTVNVGGDPESTVVQKHVDTGIAMQDVDGALFRVKAVLDTPVNGATESYWLTLRQMDYSYEIMPLNQYRIRGISDVGYRSDWVYSELRNEQNELLVYEMLYDLLDIMTTVREGDIDIMMNMIARDAYKSFHTKDRTKYDYVFDHIESLTLDPAERAILQSRDEKQFMESIDARLEEVFSVIGKDLGREFREVFMVSSKEFANILKQYRATDQLKQRINDFMTLTLEIFLEDALDRVVQKANLEVLVENGENKQLYLEGSYNLDIKNELLKSAYNIMPTDDFVLKANGTVQLIIGPVVWETINIELTESMKQDLNFFKNEILEAITAQPSEDVMLLMRLFVEEGFFPYLFTDQMAALVQTDLYDELRQQDNIKEGIVEYQMTSDQDVSRYMIVRDIVEQLVKGDQLPHADAYFLGLLDHLVSSMQSTAQILVDYGIIDVFDRFSEIGERLEYGYKAIKGQLSDDYSFDAQDDVYLYSTPAAQPRDHIQISTGDHAFVSKDSHLDLLDQITFLMEGSAIAQPNPILSGQDHMQLDQIDIVDLVTAWHSTLSEYYDLLTSDQIDIQESGIYSLEEGIGVSPVHGFYPTYMPHLKDRRAREIKEGREVMLTPQLTDRYRISGREKVRYALGNGFDQGWPLGTFRLGVNTLKGVST